MQPENLEELVLYKHHFTGGRRTELDDYVDLGQVVEPSESA